jgi:hypothetical protein
LHSNANGNDKSPNMRPFIPSEIHGQMFEDNMNFQALNTNQPSIHLSPRENKDLEKQGNLAAPPDISMILKEAQQPSSRRSNKQS